jgi:HSP20 family molecular chaperone IbpA
MAEVNQSREAAAPAASRAVESRRGRVVHVPRVDVLEGAEDFRIVADLPGVGPGGVEVTVERNVLTVVGRAERKAPEGYRHVYGAAPATEYRRVFTLSDAVDSSAIEASMKHGILTLRLPKARALRPRKISIAAA